MWLNLVEYHIANVMVAGSSPVIHSFPSNRHGVTSAQYGFIPSRGIPLSVNQANQFAVNE